MLAVRIEVIGGGVYSVGTNGCERIEEIQTGPDSAAYTVILKNGMIYINEYAPVVVTYEED